MPNLKDGGEFIGGTLLLLIPRCILLLNLSKTLTMVDVKQVILKNLLT